jgi:DNA-binding protein HU-beta
LNATEFTKNFASKLNISQNEASEHISSLTAVFEEAFKKKKAIAIPRFGHFSTRKVESRKGYSPLLKKYVIFPPKRVLEFQPSEQLKDRIKNIETS